MDNIYHLTWRSHGSSYYPIVSSSTTLEAAGPADIPLLVRYLYRFLGYSPSPSHACQRERPAIHHHTERFHCHFIWYRLGPKIRTHHTAGTWNNEPLRRRVHTNELGSIYVIRSRTAGDVGIGRVGHADEMVSGQDGWRVDQLIGAGPGGCRFG